MLFSRLSAICALWLVVLSANATYNVTVEPSDTYMLQYHPTSCLSYDGEWQIKEDSGFRDGVGYFCDAPGSTVTFTFVGIAVYFLSPRWPYPIGLCASIDGKPFEYINVTDPNSQTDLSGNITVPSRSVWSATKLQNGQHIVIFGNATSKGNSSDFYVDAFIYTALEDAAAPTSSLSRSKLAIGMGVAAVLAFILFMLSCFALWYYNTRIKPRKLHSRNGAHAEDNTTRSNQADVISLQPVSTHSHSERSLVDTDNEPTIATGNQPEPVPLQPVPSEPDTMLQTDQDVVAPKDQQSLGTTREGTVCENSGDSEGGDGQSQL